MKRMIIVFAMVVMGAISVAAQTTATPAEQTRVRALVTELSKAQSTFTTRRDALPETKAMATATEAQDKAARSLPEWEALKSTEAKVLDELYRILADHKLSSREYRPAINDKGELAFVKAEPPPPVKP